MILFALTACLRSVPTQAAPLHPATSIDLEAPGPLRHEAVVSATWAVPLSGLLDLDDPRTEGMKDERYPIVLPVHVLAHPTAGTFVIDSGVPRGDLPVSGLIARFVRDLVPVETLASILERQAAPLAGVLLTHAHVDHVLGLPDVDAGIPIYAGPGEEVPHGMNGALTFGTFQRSLGDRTLTSWDFDQATSIEGIPALDVIGDGSLWALHVPGHTPGSTAYLARTVDGPVLFTGDCSHTRWGWDHDVPPGSYTFDHQGNVASLAALRALAAAHPSMRVEVGHEVAP